ncbi:MAG: methionyl-tRNA formyltransferase [Pseudomonadota bacterium]
MNHYLVVANRRWSIDAFNRYAAGLAGQWSLVTDPQELTEFLATGPSLRYIFFPHWSQLVDAAIFEKYECVCFHMTDLPYGRGGSPLQNLIERGHSETKLTALRMDEEIDGGAIYLKKPLSLHGNAQEIYVRANDLIFDMITEIIEREPLPRDQVGEIVTFSRRTPEMSVLPKETDLTKLYDHIRMLDAPGYPRAFLEFGSFRLEFSHARFNENDELVTQVTLTPKSND